MHLRCSFQMRSQPWMTFFFFFVAARSLCCCTQAFSSSSKCDLLSSCGVQASLLITEHRLWGVQASLALVRSLAALRHVRSYQTGGWTDGLCIARLILSHWTTRELLWPISWLQPSVRIISRPSWALSVFLTSQKLWDNKCVLFKLLRKNKQLVPFLPQILLSKLYFWISNSIGLVSSFRKKFRENSIWYFFATFKSIKMLLEYFMKKFVKHKMWDLYHWNVLSLVIRKIFNDL